MLLGTVAELYFITPSSDLIPAGEDAIFQCIVDSRCLFSFLIINVDCLVRERMFIAACALCV